MARLSFKLTEDERGLVSQTRILVDDIDILSEIGANLLGIESPIFFSQPALKSSGELLIGQCSCGVIDCRNAVMITHHSHDYVEWTARDQDSNSWCTRDTVNGALDKFTFVRSEYDTALEKGSRLAKKVL